MKIILSIFIIVFSAISVMAQKSINLNRVSIQNYQELSLTENNSAGINEAKRFRELDLNPKIQNTELIRMNDTLLLDLFNEKQYKACIDKIGVDKNGTISIRARLLNYNYGYCLISTFNSKSAIIIEVPEKNEFYKVKFDQQTSKYYLIQVDKTKQTILEGAPAIMPPTDSQNNKSPNKKRDEGSDIIRPENTVNNHVISYLPTTQDTVKLMVVYTPAAAAWSVANETSIETTIGLLMGKAQLALDNSGTFLEFQLVHSDQVNYLELNNDTDLDILQNNGDGIMDEVHVWRNTYCADVVVLLEKISFTGGLGYLLNTTSGLPDYAFSLTRVQQASSTFTTVHEIGHNMGCNHHKLQNFQPGNDTLFPYSAGWRWTGNDSGKYCSVMCYEDGQYFPDGISHTRVAYFSNPGIQYQGVATGHADSGDNARTIREIKSVIANYREGCCPTVQASGFTSSSISDTTMTIGWTRGNGSSVLVVAKESSAVNACPVFGTTYVANTSFGSGTQIGIGNYVLYNGTGTSVNIKKLKVGTTYHFAIYEYKTDNKCYLSPALIGNSTTTSVYCTAGSNALPVVITAQTTLIKSYTATSGGTVNCDAGSAIIARGVCYSLHPIPTLADNFTINGADTGTFISNLTGLIPDTVYYVRAYITDSAGTVYGNERTFRTLLYYYGEWVTDYDGMSYASLILGNQQWLAWNLSVIHYNNGDPIPNIPLGSYWYNTTSGAFVNWGNSPITAEIYGRLYNYYAVVDSRNLCPVGWHVPSDAEWTILINYLGGSSVAGGKLKEAGTDHWNSPNTGATNRSGFTALPGGVADWDFFSYYVTFYSIRVNGYFWTSTEISGTSSARYKFLSKNSSTIGGGANPMYLGQSVRCIKN